MRQSATSFVLLLLLTAVASSVCFAQDKTPQNAALNKKACDFLSKSDAESILGQSVELRATNATQCWYVETGWTNKPPKNKHVRFEAWFWTTPQFDQFAETRKYLVEHPPPSAVVKEVRDFGDAAIWLWAGSGGTLYAFKGGTIQVDVTIAGLPEDQALQQAKALAAKPFGGTAGTGYVYLGTPKGDAGVAAKAAADAAAEAAALAKLLQQGKTFSQAPYITESQFLKLVKEVALTFEGASSLEKYVSAAEQRSTVERELAKYGITVRPNAPVSVLATVTYKVSVYTKTYVRGGSGGDEFPIHGLTFELKFFGRAAAMRDRKLHLVAAAPADCSTFGTVDEATSFQKALYGDSTLKDIRDEYINDVVVCLKSIATNMNAETKPWSVMSWPDKDKASADAEFTKIMSGQAAMDKRQLDGLETVPELLLTPTRNGDFCIAPDPSWRDLWIRAFRRVGLTETRGEPTLLLSHDYNCYFRAGFTPLHFFRVFDIISLVERNLVFELNGKVVRKAGELLSSVHHTYMLEQDMASSSTETMESPTENYFPRSITDFLVDLATGRGNIPPIAAAPVSR